MVDKRENKMQFTKEMLHDNAMQEVERVVETGFVLKASNGNSLFVTDELLDALIKARREERGQTPSGYLFKRDDDVVHDITKYRPTFNGVHDVRPLFED
jgi:hypothetical protein